MQNPTFFFIVFLSLLSVVLASLTPYHAPSQPTQSPKAACKSTPYPKLCRTILGSIRSSPSDPYGYGKFSVKQCLKQAKRLSKGLHRYLKRKKKIKLSHEEEGALEDCYELAELNVDYLERIASELKTATDMNDDEVVDRVQTLLSGLVTNQMTCYDGLEEAKSSFASILAEPLMNTTQLYSVSLGLVTKSMTKNMKRKKKDDHMAKKHNPIKEPLNTLIQALKQGPCNCSSHVNCLKQGRNLREARSNGILIYDIVTVGQSNSTNNFTSIYEAIEFAPKKTEPEDGYFVIYVTEGIYEEYVFVDKHKRNVLMIGDGINRTIITGNHSFVDGWTTFHSATFAVAGERFIAVDITFRNTAGPHKHQAVAVRNSADLSTFYRCSFEGYQDTLYVHSLRQFYRECDIYGTIDFIFGNSAAVLQDCHLYARKPLPNQKNAFTAQGRSDPNQNTGISIHNCTIEATPDLSMDLNSTLTFLGRPWKQYSRTVIMQSYIGDLISPVGWLEWNETFALDTLFYGEYGNYGPGANTSNRVQWPGYSLMNATLAFNFTVYNFTLGDTWLPYTDVPYNGGLIS